MAAIKSWFDMVKGNIVKSSLVPNVIFGSLLACMEKLMGLEFDCPCNSEMNALLVAGYLFVPAVLSLWRLAFKDVRTRSVQKDGKDVCSWALPRQCCGSSCCSLMATTWRVQRLTGRASM